MGNTTSDVNDSLKAQADSENGPEIYKLVNVSGGGELTRLMKLAMQTKDFTEVDDLIKTEVIKYLYNDGKGEKVNLYDSSRFNSNSNNRSFQSEILSPNDAVVNCRLKQRFKS